MSEMKIMRGAEPFFYPGSRIGCLVVHGFTGTPNEVRWLGQHLNHHGYTVHGPRLAGHGTHPDDMLPIRWREWYLDVLAGYEMLCDRCDQVFAVGLSMGGALSLLLASREPVAGVVAMSTPHDVGDRRVRYLPVARYFVPRVGKSGPPLEEHPFHQRVLAEQQRRGDEAIGHPAYPFYPTRSVIELDRLLAEMRASLPRVTAPTLFIHSKMDDVVGFAALENNLALLTASSDKEAVVLENSLHVITEDVERDRVFETVAHFVAAHT